MLLNITQVCHDTDKLSNTVNEFTDVDIVNDVDDIDGNYGIVNNKRNIMIRCGTTAVGITKIWKERTTCSF